MSDMLPLPFPLTLQLPDPASVSSSMSLSLSLSEPVGGRADWPIGAGIRGAAIAVAAAAAAGKHSPGPGGTVLGHMSKPDRNPAGLQERRLF